MRPVVNGMKGPKRSSSELISAALGKIRDIMKPKSVIKSTEEFLYWVEKYNKENKNRDKSVIIGSMDAVNLYPSIKPDKAADIIKKLIVDTEVDFKGIELISGNSQFREIDSSGKSTVSGNRQFREIDSFGALAVPRKLKKEMTGPFSDFCWSTIQAGFQI